MILRFSMILEEDCLNENKFSETVLVTYFWSRFRVYRLSVVISRLTGPILGIKKIEFVPKTSKARDTKTWKKFKKFQTFKKFEKIFQKNWFFVLSLNNKKMT